MASLKTDKRVIGRWTIGQTLTKEKGYSWTKYGQDIKTGKIVSLTFIQKSDIIFTKEQAKMIETELSALNNIRHKNVKSLYSYHLNAAYPLRKFHSDDTQKYLDTILLIQEYNPGQRELYDLCYYYCTAFRESVARTFFKQLISGLEACHNSGVVHADLKIESLLLDTKGNNCNLQINNAGFSNIIPLDATSKSMVTAQNMGAICCKAPELLSNQKYDLKCDIFSAGVILFVMLAGYPPFEMALKSDPWFIQLIKGKYEKFWKAHQKTSALMSDVKDLLTKMLTFDAKQRIDINGIKNHKWYKGNVLNGKELFTEFRNRYYKAEKKRQSDIRHVPEFAEISNIHKSKLKCIETRLSTLKLELFPENEIEGMYCDIYTHIDSEGKHWYEIYNLIEQAITSNKYQGYAYFDWDKLVLVCVMAVAKQCKKNNETIRTEQTVKFCIKVFESRMWKEKHLQSDEADEIEEENKHNIFIVRVNRIEGDSVILRDIRNSFLALYCSTILQGLPRWARKVQRNDYIYNKHHEIDEEKHELVDDYQKIIDENDWKKQSETNKDTNLIDLSYPIYPLTAYKTYVFWEAMENQLEDDGMDFDNVDLLMRFFQKNSYDFKSVVTDMNYTKPSKSRLVSFFNDMFNRKALELFNILYKTIFYLASQKKYSCVVYNNSNKFWVNPHQIDLLTNGFIRKYIEIKIVANDIIIECSNFHGYMSS
eukprot:513446_1